MARSSSRIKTTVGHYIMMILPTRWLKALSPKPWSEVPKWKYGFLPTRALGLKETETSVGGFPTTPYISANTGARFHMGLKHQLEMTYEGLLWSPWRSFHRNCGVPQSGSVDHLSDVQAHLGTRLP